MQGSDDDRTAPTVVVVLDELALRRTETEVPQKGRLRGLVKTLLKAPADTVIRWETNPIAVAAIDRLARRTHVNIELITYWDELASISAVTEAAHIPHRSLRHTHPILLAGDLTYRPDIAAVYHAYPEHAMKFGTRGRYLRPDQHSMIGII